MFSSWVISITGIVLLGLVADVMLPEGKINKYIKSIFAIITVFVIVLPLPSFFNSFSQTSDVFFNENQIFLDEYFLDKLKEERQSEKEAMLAEVFKEHGFENIEINVLCDNESDFFKIKLVQLNIKNLVIQNEDKNINIKDKLLELIFVSMGINLNQVVFYE